MSEAKQKALAAIEALGLSIDAKFIPFSQSRNKGQDYHNLNWSITVKRNGKDVLTTDYSAGSAHCPGYNVPNHVKPERFRTIWRNAVVAWECENGFKGQYSESTGTTSRAFKTIKLEPDVSDVFYSLVMDSQVLDYSSFEDAADNWGYDVDSRKAEAIYRACLEIALKLRASIGESGLKALSEAFEDY
jgi:hypothetical protein